MGYNASASGTYSIAIGSSITNSVDNSTILGGNNDILARFEVPVPVTQGTSLVTGVTNDTAQGKITLFSVLAGNIATRFTVTNSRVRATSVIRALAESVSTTGLPSTVGIMSVTTGSFDIIVYNPDSVNATTAAPIIHYDVLYPAL